MGVETAVGEIVRLVRTRLDMERPALAGDPPLHEARADAANPLRPP